MLVDVKCAKHIRYKMTDRADMGVMGETPRDNYFPDEDRDGPAASNATGSILEDCVQTPWAHFIDNIDFHSPEISASIFLPRPSPRPLVTRHGPQRTRSDDGGDLMVVLKSQIFQEVLRRE